MRFMGKLLTFISILFLTTTSFAAEISESDAKIFLNDWLSAQNKGSYSDYAAMYSKSFVGIKRSGKSTRKLDYNAWFKDRKNMFKKKMLVTANSPEIKISGTAASIKFEQTWESGTYKDKGDKVLDLALEGRKLRIIREEMLFSKINTTSCKQNYTTIDNQKANIANRDIFSTKYTSILDKNCSKVDMKLLMNFTGAESALECPAPKGWRLFKVYDRDSERSWFNIANKQSVWSTAEQVRINPKYFFGYFPNIDSSPRVEWRMSNGDLAKTLIFRVAAADPENADKWLSRLYIISLEENKPYFCGFATTNEEAIKITNSNLNCTELLNKELDFK